MGLPSGLAGEASQPLKGRHFTPCGAVEPLPIGKFPCTNWVEKKTASCSFQYVAVWLFGEVPPPKKNFLVKVANGSVG